MNRKSILALNKKAPPIIDRDPWDIHTLANKVIVQEMKSELSITNTPIDGSAKISESEVAIISIKDRTHGRVWAIHVDLLEDNPYTLVNREEVGLLVSHASELENVIYEVVPVTEAGDHAPRFAFGAWGLTVSINNRLSAEFDFHKAEFHIKSLGFRPITTDEALEYAESVRIFALVLDKVRDKIIKLLNDSQREG